MKQEIAHMTSFAELQSLCVLLGNTTLPLLNKVKNLNYLSKLMMREMVATVGLANMLNSQGISPSSLMKPQIYLLQRALACVCSILTLMLMRR